MSITSALIPAAGKGKRFGSDLNKVFAELLGKPVIAHTLAAFQACRAIDEIILVAGEADVSFYPELIRRFGPFDKLKAVVQGGKERGDSVRAGLELVAGDIVVIHDGARPLVNDDTILASIETARESGAAVAAVPVVDTIKQADEQGFVEATLDRSRLYQIQTPQTFRTDLIRQAYQWAQEHGVAATDDAALYEMAVGKVKLVPGSYDNLKITGQQDLAVAERKLEDLGKTVSSEQSAVSSKDEPLPSPPSQGEGAGSVEPMGNPLLTKEGQGEVIYSAPSTQHSALPPLFRTGFGYDIHRLAPGRRLVLGGVEFDSPVGLLGHSDADVILHAIADALLGAAALGDIGKLFPNTDPAYKDADSLKLLKHVADRLADEGWSVVNVDAMMIGEQPKISPHSDKMRSNISGAIGISDSSISIKATTAEGLGYIGSGDGICCYAVATISRK